MPTAATGAHIHIHMVVMRKAAAANFAATVVVVGEAADVATVFEHQ